MIVFKSSFVLCLIGVKNIRKKVAKIFLRVRGHNRTVHNWLGLGIRHKRGPSNFRAIKPLGVTVDHCEHLLLLFSLLCVYQSYL